MNYLLPADEAVLEEIAGEICRFLKAMELVLENIMINKFSWFQNHIKEEYEALFPLLQDRLANLSSSLSSLDLYQDLAKALDHLQEAYSLFCGASGTKFLEQFLDSIHLLSLAQYILYDLKSELSCLDKHWLAEEGHIAMPEYFESTENPISHPVGFIHRGHSDSHQEYTLYVPEYYHPYKKWPLIVCLHGGGGHGYDYIWTWLRPARTKGYLVLSPKSVGFTWSLLGEDYDEISVLNMLEEIGEQYQVAFQEILLTGLSDGGSYAFHFGFKHPELFAGLAPVAGLISGRLRGIKDLPGAKKLPVLQIHGALDFVFPVGMARAVYQFLSRQQFNILYQELPDWGHAFPYRINENIILPWFERLRARGPL
jgi:predicted esterase